MNYFLGLTTDQNYAGNKRDCQVPQL